MRKLIIRVLVALLTFEVGITAASLWYYTSSNSRFSKPVSRLFATTQERTYQRGPAGEATTGSFITLNSSDGMHFTKWSVYCRSAEGARRELEERTKAAVQIISRESVVDKSGQQIGEKIVAVFSPNDSRHCAASLLWTENEEMFQVAGSSLQNILEYRKDFKR